MSNKPLTLEEVNETATMAKAEIAGLRNDINSIKLSMAATYPKEGVATYPKEWAAAYTNDLVGSVPAQQIPYGTASKQSEGDYKKNWLAVYGSDSAVPAGGRRKRTRRRKGSSKGSSKGSRRGTRRYRK